ncbi:MAG: nucleotidyltransferase family protein [Defluviitaleaceae bacterium]|nr:nucleotidyltransferase family protein [Defluviitaleaceae bacterium]
MNAVGIIAEFNPFHEGHAEHLRETKKISGREKIIAAMSGNFVQRGEPAIVDKFLRTKMALVSGVDVVIEIPVPYVLCGADFFARAGVGLLAATGVVDALSFGSESGDIDAIKTAARVLAEEPDAYKKILHEELSRGKSFAAARGNALRETCGNDDEVGKDENFFTKPNNTLAMEYCKALQLLKSPMEVFTTHRKSGGASATKIRKMLLSHEKNFYEENFSACEISKEKNFSSYEIFENLSEKNFLPREIFEILREKNFLPLEEKISSHEKNFCEKYFTSREKKFVTLDDFSEIFRFVLFSRNFILGEGLENRFKKFCGDFDKISDFVAAVKTKRYTHTRLQRAVLRVILGIDAPVGDPQYIRVLGFRRESADLLGEITKKAALPVITNGAAIDEIFSRCGDMLAKEFEAGDIFRCVSGARGGFRSERAAQIVIV